MNTLRAPVGASFLLAVMGLVVIVPLGWGPVLGIAATSPEKIVQGQPYQLVENKILSRGTYEGIKYKIAA